MLSIFSRIVNGELPAHKVAENDSFLAFLDISPLVEGHTLVIPKKEVDLIWDLSDAELAGLHLFSKEVAVKLKRVIPCMRIGMSVIGLEVPHAHIHLIPMNSVYDMDFSRPKLTLSQDRMAEIAKAIQEA